MCIRDRPNPLLAPSGAYHLFDGDAMLHGVRLDGSGAAYRNRWVRSKGMLAEAEAGRPLFSGLAGFELPPADVVANVGMMKNTANTHVISHAGRMLAPVSYTHLDVYKRQIQSCPNSYRYRSSCSRLISCKHSKHWYYYCE